MNQADAKRWQEALSPYRYPVSRNRAIRFARRIDLTTIRVGRGQEPQEFA